MGSPGEGSGGGMEGEGGHKHRTFKKITWQERVLPPAEAPTPRGSLHPPEPFSSLQGSVFSPSKV